MDTVGGDDTATRTAAAEARLRMEAQQMRQKSMSYTRGTRDITEIFTKSSKQLPSGELVKDDFFTLFEAVGALEVRVLSYCKPPLAPLGWKCSIS